MTDKEWTTLQGKCVITHKPYSVRVLSADLQQYRQRGGLAQNIFSYLPKGDREFIISGISPEGWDTIFTEEDKTL